MALIFTTNGAALGAVGATMTFAHGLGVTPDIVYLALAGLQAAATSTAILAVLGRDITNVYAAVQSGGGAALVNITAQKFHTIIQ